jgi:tetratricopeptide (TPR) repeat protein
MIARALLLILVGSTLYAEGQSAAERTERARAHFERGKAHFNLGEYEQAILEFEAGYREKPQPLFLYDIAESARKAGQREKALRMYRRYLLEKPDATERPQIEKHVVELAQEQKEAPLPTPPAPEPSSAPAPESTPPPPTPSPEPASPLPDPRAMAPLANAPPAERPWARDPLAIALATLGGAALVVGVIDLAVELPRWQARNDSYPAHHLALAAPAQLTADLVLIPVGAVLLAASGLRWGLVHRARVRAGVAGASIRLAVDF